MNETSFHLSIQEFEPLYAGTSSLFTPPRHSEVGGNEAEFVSSTAVETEFVQLASDTFPSDSGCQSQRATRLRATRAESFWQVTEKRSFEYILGRTSRKTSPRYHRGAYITLASIFDASIRRVRCSLDDIPLGAA